MVVYEKKIHGRLVLSPKVMHFPIFTTPRFQFQQHLNFQGLQPFLGMKLPYYENLARVFYRNLKFTAIGDLSIVISSQQIETWQI